MRASSSRATCQPGGGGRGVDDKHQALAGSLDQDEHTKALSVNRLGGKELRLPRWLGACGIAIGALAFQPRACARRTVPPSAAAHDRVGTASYGSTHDRVGTVSYGSTRRRPAAAGCEGAYSHSAAADPPGSPGARYASRGQTHARRSGRSSCQARSGLTRDAANSYCLRWPRSRTFPAIRALENFSKCLARRRNVQHRLRQQLVELAVLVIERLRPTGVRYLHPTLMVAPNVERRIAAACPSGRPSEPASPRLPAAK